MKNMVEVGIRALKQNASAVVAEAAAGETVTITDRGRPVAQMTSVAASPLQRMLANGTARAARRDLAALPAPTEAPALTPVLDEMRDDERY
jgi:prevent-host-death family protein